MIRLLVAAPFAVVLLASTVAVSEPGPVPPVVLLRRYGLLVLAPVLAALGLVGALLAPTNTAVALGLIVVGAVTFPGVARWTLRRTLVRARWASVCRSAGLTTMDRRPNELGGSTVDIKAEAVEWLPVISWGRRTGPTTVAWKLAPARGSTIHEVAERSEALAAALGVAAVVVHRERPPVGRLEVRWDA